MKLTLKIRILCQRSLALIDHHSPLQLKLRYHMFTRMNIWAFWHFSSKTGLQNCIVWVSGIPFHTWEGQNETNKWEIKYQCSRLFAIHFVFSEFHFPHGLNSVDGNFMNISDGFNFRNFSDGWNFMEKNEICKIHKTKSVQTLIH